ncbi:MAG: hypothetical protein ABWY78_06220 [Microvirga sp.]
MTNFIQTENPWGLATPPAWFLAQLHAYDPLLVIFPSKVAPLYRMARRTSSGRAQLNKIIRGIPDSEIYLKHKLWAWKSVEPQSSVMLNGGWGKLLLEIPEYDQQRFGTWKEVADRVDDLDVQQERTIDRDIQGELDARGHDAYLLAQARLGSRVSLGVKKPEGARLGRRSSPKQAYRPLNFGGGGAIFIGR